ncbi:hypothetical protein [Homoserinimonas hongtaonis]|uniref:hypothetical protein n=1 Tax=Homoserinimonas hongtaonis TaxID=2079791 RepID=UPI000D373128|nr:hypothetical protein [Salinibacterium hongtaonis]AWB88753.1 hypothetical protein C2138_03595 [Salinibacterium hongtaonis]
MTIHDEKLLASIVADTVAKHPLPAQYTDLEPSSRDYVERMARHAGETPEAYYSRSRKRSDLSASDRYSAQIRDESERRAAVQKLADDLGDIDNILGDRAEY